MKHGKSQNGQRSIELCFAQCITGQALGIISGLSVFEAACLLSCIPGNRLPSVMPHHWRLLGLLLLGVAACAVPVSPTGGLPNQDPPQVLSILPADGAVNVDTDVIQITFSEYINQGSFPRAVSITPSFEQPLEFRWRRRSVEVRLPEPLRPNTTYILTLDTNLRDFYNVALKQPITLAFSTGATINQGKLRGHVVDAMSGENVSGMDVFAYAVPDSAAPDSLPTRPDYRTQTDDTGTFTFSYLNEQPYFIVALRDLNRNRVLDAIEPFAVPPQPAILADSTGAPLDVPWLVTTQDTLRPALERVRSLSSQRLTARFTEAIQLTETSGAGWVLRDSVGSQVEAIRGVYVLPSDPRQVYVLTDSLRSEPYTLVPAHVADSSGNLVLTDLQTVTPRARADTFRVYWQGFEPDVEDAGIRLLAPEIQPVLRFSQTVDSALFHEVVNVQDTTGQSFNYHHETDDGVAYRLRLDPPVGAEQVIEVAVNAEPLYGADTVFTARFQRLSDRDLGELTGYVFAEDSTVAIILEVYSQEAEDMSESRLIYPDSTGRFLVNRLPDAGLYRFRAFEDRNNNQRWDGGLVIPYRPAESLLWYDAPEPVRARWETEIPDTLRIPIR